MSRELPAYMVPASFVQLDKIPRTPNGKVDKKSLPHPEIDIGDNYIAPRNETEEKLAQIWSQVLDVDKEIIGIESNFFDLRGNSLKATIMVGKIYREFNADIQLEEVFKSPDIKGISALIEVMDWANTQQPGKTKEGKEEEIII
ncbi:MAG: hypothetical protein GY940_48085 [bacterium]|nr:hypothetical protein [bacterium]